MPATVRASQSPIVKSQEIRGVRGHNGKGKTEDTGPKVDPAVEAVLQELRPAIPADGSSFNYERLLVERFGDYVEMFVMDRLFSPCEVEIQMMSTCNLCCRWCIGEELQERSSVKRLDNKINRANFSAITDGIIDMNIGGLGIQRVKFSGFIGEPLLSEAALPAIRTLVGANKEVVLFTNGILMGKQGTIETLANIRSVHVSLDAGPNSYYLLKEHRSATFGHTFERVMTNIRALSEYRRSRGGRVHIMVGYVVVPGNHMEICETVKRVQNEGADGIRFKCDIAGQHDLQEAGLVADVFERIASAKAKFEIPGGFTVETIHSQDDVLSRRYGSWRCTDGCFFHQFMSTIGSDGGVYLCDHNSMPGAIQLGHALCSSLQEIWQSDCRKYLTAGFPYHICRSSVCPPFGNRANFFLKKLRELADSHGKDCVREAVRILRSEYRGGGAARS